jgi:NADH pyrophosphatase NudC (nudix superfamily)
MARSTKRSAKAEQVRAYVEGVAKNLVDKLYGPDGPPWGTTLTDIEDLLLEVREVLTEQMLDLTLTRQAQALPQQSEAERFCPSCQQQLACEDANPRIVQTRAGEAEWSEPQGYCARCRRAFFPSSQKPGHRPD